MGNRLSCKQGLELWDCGELVGRLAGTPQYEELLLCLNHQQQTHKNPISLGETFQAEISNSHMLFDANKLPQA